MGSRIAVRMHDGVQQAAVPAAPASSNTSAPAAGGQTQPTLRDAPCLTPVKAWLTAWVAVVGCLAVIRCLWLWLWFAVRVVGYLCVWLWFVVWDCDCGLMSGFVAMVRCLGLGL